MKILIVNDHLGWNEQLHGVGRLIELWATHLDCEKFDVTVCIIGEKDGLGKNLEDQGIKVRFLGKGKFDPTTLISLIRLIKNEKIDVLHVQGYRGTTFGRLAGRIAGIPVLVHFHDTVPNYPFIQKISDRLLGRLQVACVAVSNATKDLWAKRCRIDPENITMMNNCTSLTEFQPLDAAQVQAHKAHFGITSGGAVIGVVARLHETKGIEFLLHAALEILEKFPDTSFLIAGDGPLKEQLKALANELGIARKVVFTGFVADVSPIFGILDVYVLPSINREGTPLSILEAMAAEKPIVVTDTVEIMENGLNSIVVPRAESKPLAESIIYLLENEAVAKSLGAAARNMSEKFDVTHYARDLGNIYESLVSSKRDRVHAGI